MARSNNNSNEAIEDGEEGLWSKAGHSLRQPIQAALYLVHILKARTEEPELSKVTGMLEAALNGLQGQIELLIELSRVDRFALSPVRLDNALNAASVLVGPICSARSVEFLCSKTDERVTSNERLLTLLITGLLLNALRLRTGGPLSTSVRRSAQNVIFEVGFEGPLVGKAQLETAFVELADATSGRPSGSVGLGLGFVMRVAAQLGHGFRAEMLPPGRQRLILELIAA